MQPAETYAGGTIIEAWRAAATRVAAAGDPPYIIVVTAGPGWEGLAADRHALDLAADSVGAERPTAVAEMLLPRVVQLSTDNPDGAIEAGLKLLGRGRKRGLRFSSWTHTYFERMVGAWYDRLGAKREIKNNRLKDVIQKLIEWDRNAEAVFYLHTDISSDSFRPRGSPCLQYVQFRAHGDKKLSVTGLYRAHDYTNKFLGNAMGLQRLGQFVARHANREFDGVAIVSLHPFCGNKHQLRSLIDHVGAN